jgi:hypothetical protein
VLAAAHTLNGLTHVAGFALGYFGFGLHSVSA